MANSLTKCCVVDCVYLGRRADSQGRLYCLVHWHEKFENDDNDDFGCSDCETVKKCAVDDCLEAGIITQSGTGKKFCAAHAWKSDRLAEKDENGLTHPQVVWDEDDIIWAKMMGIKIHEC